MKKVTLTINGSVYELWEDEWQKCLRGQGDYPPFLMKHAARVQNRELEEANKLLDAQRALIASQRETIRQYERLDSGNGGATSTRGPRQGRKRKVQEGPQSTESTGGEAEAG